MGMFEVLRCCCGYLRFHPTHWHVASHPHQVLRPRGNSCCKLVGFVLPVSTITVFTAKTQIAVSFRQTLSQTPLAVYFLGIPESSDIIEPRTCGLHPVTGTADVKFENMCFQPNLCSCFSRHTGIVLFSPEYPDPFYTFFLVNVSWQFSSISCTHSCFCFHSRRFSDRIFVFQTSQFRTRFLLSCCSGFPGPNLREQKKPFRAHQKPASAIKPHVVTENASPSTKIPAAGRN